MRKLILLLVVSMLVISCGGSDDESVSTDSMVDSEIIETPPIQLSIVGSWELSNGSQPPSDCEKQTILKITEDLNYSIVGVESLENTCFVDFKEEGKYIIDGSQVSFIEDGVDEFTENASFELVDDTLTLTFNFEEETVFFTYKKTTNSFFENPVETLPSDFGIVGKWILESDTVDDSNAENLSLCIDKKVIEFTTNGNFKEDNTFIFSGECISDSFKEGTFEIIDSILILDITSDFGSFEDVELVTIENEKLIIRKKFNSDEFNRTLTYKRTESDFLTDNIESKIIGIWNLTELIIDGTNQELSDCERFESIEFFNDDRFENVFFTASQNTPELCVSSDFVDGTYTIINNDTLRLSEIDTNNTPLDQDYIISFIDNTLTLSFSTEENGVTTRAQLIYSKNL